MDEPKKQTQNDLLLDASADEGPQNNEATKPSSDVPPKPAAAAPSGSKRKHHPLQWIKTHKKKTAIIAVLLVLFLGGGSVLAYTQLRKDPPPTPAPAPVVEEKPVEPPAPTTKASPLTGVQVSPELADRPVTGMVVENSPEARPQSGLSEAGVVFEATAEGGITRFIAFWQEAQPKNIGPVRSLRPYFIDWALPFQASVGHVGGSPQALSEVGPTGLRDIDQGGNGKYFRRTTDRYAPHNVYTTSGEQDSAQRDKGFTKSEFTPWPRKADEPMATPTKNNITFDISSALFRVNYTYDKASNTYPRKVAGEPHINREDKKQIAPKVVIVLKMAHRLVDAQHYGITTTGSGTAYVFQDGGVTEGTWSKADRKSMFEFKDTAGAPIKLNAGQAWISILPADRGVTSTQ